MNLDDFCQHFTREIAKFAIFVTILDQILCLIFSEFSLFFSRKFTDYPECCQIPKIVGKSRKTLALVRFELELNCMKLDS